MDGLPFKQILLRSIMTDLHKLILFDLIIEIYLDSEDICSLKDSDYLATELMYDSYLLDSYDYIRA